MSAMQNLVLNKMPWSGAGTLEVEPLLTREWLLTNGLGGYASGSVSGACTRRYHGLLIAALPAPWGRMVMLSHLFEELRLADGRLVLIGGEEPAEQAPELHGAQALTEFRLEHGLPVWRYEVAGSVLEKRVLLPHQQNTVHVTYRLLEGNGRFRLRLRPALNIRPHEGRVDLPLEKPYTLTVLGERIEVCSPGSGLDPLKMQIWAQKGQLVLDGGQFRDVYYRVEHRRGYEAKGCVWRPGYFRVDLEPGEEATLVASTEVWDVFLALDPGSAYEAELQRRQRLIAAAHPAARGGLGAELVLAADQFIITPTMRVADAARAHASGDEVRTVIAGYHWFTDWGRDTMISLEGLTLTTGRAIEAGYILRTFAHYVKDGLIPNLFPEGEQEGLYHTSDATLWFFQAVHRYLELTGDRDTLRRLLPVLEDIAAHHVRGTRFGIGVDPRDALLRQGAPGYQLTWMDAKVDDWVVTPRRGKAVEINALWYNALRLLEGWVREEKDEDAARATRVLAERVQSSFNERFWYAEGKHLYDIVDGEDGKDDPALRPNQLFAIALTHPVLARERWDAVLSVVREKLLTPVGLRSLAAGHPDYKARYDGDLRSRDAAYHQGTVWSWLIGPFVDAWLKLHPNDRAGARSFLEGFRPHLSEACIGSISEVFDAEAPFTPRGCIAQAWGVAEVLRCWVKTEPE
jgi:predicted glycogen debranching enzyme